MATVQSSVQSKAPLQPPPTLQETLGLAERPVSRHDSIEQGSTERPPVQSVVTGGMPVRAGSTERPPVRSVVTGGLPIRAVVTEGPPVLTGGLPVQAVGSGSTSILHEAPTRSGRWPSTRVFNDTVVQLVTALKAVHLDDNTTSLGAPTAPFEAIELDAAIQEDALGWRKSIKQELSSLLKMHTFTIMKGRVPQGRQLLPTRLVLKKKFNTKDEVIRLKSRLCSRTTYFTLL
jgi:hypothetical protein